MLFFWYFSLIILYYRGENTYNVGFLTCLVLYFKHARASHGRDSSFGLLHLTIWYKKNKHFLLLFQLLLQLQLFLFFHFFIYFIIFFFLQWLQLFVMFLLLLLIDWFDGYKNFYTFSIFFLSFSVSLVGLGCILGLLQLHLETLRAHLKAIHGLDGHLCRFRIIK